MNTNTQFRFAWERIANIMSVRAACILLISCSPLAQAKSPSDQRRN